jgi:uncharacterized protein (TIGR00730 family)
MRSLCIFAGSSPGARPDYRSAVTAAGGSITGVIPRSLVNFEVADSSIDDLRIVGSMHERKATLAELSDGFVAVRGGLGTLEEFTEVTTWTQLGLHTKPTGLLNVADCYSPLLDFLDRAASEGFLAAEPRNNIFASSDPDTLIDAMQAWKLADAGRWWETPP